MRVLVIGGSGTVGTLVLPHLCRTHTVRLLDPHPPKFDVAANPVEYVQGDALDEDAVRQAMDGMNAVIYMALGLYESGQSNDWKSPISVDGCFDVSVKGAYRALDLARQAGISHAVYISSLSVYQAISRSKVEKRFYVDEDMPADAQPLYGLTKRLGEEVCRNATREWNISVNVLRLCFPLSEEKWQERVRIGVPNIATAAEDVARAFDAALTFRAGFQIFHISGDYEEKLMRLSKAKALLGWEPLARPIREPDPA